MWQFIALILYIENIPCFILLLESKFKRDKKSSVILKKLKNTFFGCDIFILLCEKRHAGGPIHLNIDLGSPNLIFSSIFPKIYPTELVLNLHLRKYVTSLKQNRVKSMILDFKWRFCIIPVIEFGYIDVMQRKDLLSVFIRW